jgi:hypothetical protein
VYVFVDVQWILINTKQNKTGSNFFPPVRMNMSPRVMWAGHEWPSWEIQVFSLKIGWEETSWMVLGVRRDQWQGLLNVGMNLLDFLDSWASNSFSKRAVLHRVNYMK